MRVYKKNLFLAFLSVEIIVFVSIYIFGSNGLQSLYKLQDENQSLSKEIFELQIELNEIDHQIADLNFNDFYKEKIAREQLQMVKKDDEVYILE